MYRSLYVDDTLVAEDSQPGLADSLGGLNIGCGSDLAAGTFFSGLIDDVRIYSRAVSP
ncbi:MAG: LamG-like jellyroll fold domain-containing protein [Planctomycetota bacterium]